MSITTRISACIALSILAVSGVLAFSAGWNDVAIVDEDPHIGAGISYLTQRDMRLNPEHPPLAKDLAAVPLLLIPGLSVPTDDKSWTEDINGQWDFGREFLFYSGNNPDTITRLARIAPILMMLGLGWLVFWWTKEIAGVVAGIVALTLYALNPIVLSHGHFVTTDVPAALGAFGATYFLLRYFKKPTWRGLFVAGIAFGIAEALKFSLILLIPFFAVLAFTLAFTRVVRFVITPEEGTGGILRRFFSMAAWNPAVKMVGGTLVVGIIGYTAVIYPLYLFHVIGYPAEKQISDTAITLSSFPNQTLANIPNAFTHVPLLRPFAQYLLGLFMVFQRVTGGNTTYFLGEVSATGWKTYFPVVYLLKMPLAVHILSLCAVFVGLAAALRDARGCFGKGHSIRTRLLIILAWIEKNFAVLAMLLFLTVYWAFSLRGNLNIGVRHLLPTLPFVFSLIAIAFSRWLRMPKMEAQTFWAAALEATQRVASSASKNIFIILMLAWSILTTVATWPSFLAYFNELTGGPAGGHRYAVDSNLDWGQDLKRLGRFVEKNNITDISIDYFGWAVPEYYIPTARVHYWTAGKGVPPGWFAVSATFRQQACARPVPGFTQSTTGYCFLNNFQPVAIIGHSIFVYHLP